MGEDQEEGQRSGHLRVGYRPPNQAIEVDELFYEQLTEAE